MFMLNLKQKRSWTIQSIMLLLISLALRVWSSNCPVPAEKTWSDICSVNQSTQLRAGTEVSDFTHLPGKSHHHHCPECTITASQMPLGNATESGLFLIKLTEVQALALIQSASQSNRIALPEPRAPPSL